VFLPEVLANLVSEVDAVSCDSEGRSGAPVVLLGSSSCLDDKSPSVDVTDRNSSGVDNFCIVEKSSVLESNTDRNILSLKQTPF
jgi:hypothetical protein